MRNEMIFRSSSAVVPSVDRRYTPHPAGQNRIRVTTDKRYEFCIVYKYMPPKTHISIKLNKNLIICFIPIFV